MDYVKNLTYEQYNEALKSRDATIDQMRGALISIHEMYSHAWDREDGGLTMLAGSIPKFEAAHKAVREALGIKWLETEEVSKS